MTKTGYANDTAFNQDWLNRSKAVTTWSASPGERIVFTYDDSVEVLDCPPGVDFAGDDEGPGLCVTCGTQCIADGSLAVICPNCDWKERAIALLRALGDLGTEDLYTDAHEYQNRVGAMQSLCRMAHVVMAEGLGSSIGRITMPEIEEAAEATDEDKYEETEVEE